MYKSKWFTVYFTVKNWHNIEVLEYRPKKAVPLAGAGHKHTVSHTPPSNWMDTYTWIGRIAPNWAGKGVVKVEDYRHQNNKPSYFRSNGHSGGGPIHARVPIHAHP